MEANYADIKNYELNKTIGEGNFAKVKLSTFKPTNEQFAIKIINKKKLKEKMKHSTFREPEIIYKLKHQNIITVYQILEDLNNYYLIMEYCKKGELFDYIVEHQNLSENEASIFFYQLINGVEYIHSQNIVHRDLKPENLLLTENKILKIIDFGLGHYFDGNILLKTKCGSPSYAAPEIIIGKEYDGFKIDIWCCGVILYSMLCGFLPFGGDNDNELFQSIIECNPEIPKELSKESIKLLKKIFTPNPNKRISIPEIKQTKFYLKGKKLFNIKYEINENIINDDSFINDEKNFCVNLLELGKTNENINNNKIDNTQIIEGEDNKDSNNSEAITIISNEDDDNNIINNINKNNINIFNIKKNKTIKENQIINGSNNNIYNDDNKDNCNKQKELKDNIKIYNLQTFENLEKTLKNNKKLQINFNNNLKNNYQNKNIFNSFRKKLIKEDLNQKLKQNFNNYQKIMKSEVNNFKNNIVKMNTINQNQTQIDKTNIIYNNNHSNNANNSIINYNNISTINNNNNSNKSNKQINNILKIPYIKENKNNNARINKKLTLKLTNSNKDRQFLNSTKKLKKICFSKSPNDNNIHYLLTDNIKNETNKNTSYKKYINHFQKFSAKSLAKRKIINNDSNKERRHLNTINVKTLNHTKNTDSIEVKNINNIYNKIIINKIKFSSPWKNLGKKILKYVKLTPTISLMKNKLYNNKIKIMNITPKRTNLFYNNINININTINVNENRCKLKLNDFSDRSSNNKKRDKKKYSERDYSIKYINNKKVKINFSKLINKVKNKHNIYYYDNTKNGNNRKSLGHKHNTKDDNIDKISTGNIKLYLRERNSSKNAIISKPRYTSNEKSK